MDDNLLKKESFFSRICTFLKSPRDILYEKSYNKIQIEVHNISHHSLKKNRLPFIFLVVCFGILPLFGLFQILFELFQGNIENVHQRYAMIFVCIFYLVPPFMVYWMVVVPLFKIRSIILEPHQITIQDSFLTFKPNLKLKLSKQNIKKIERQKPSWLDKMSRQEFVEKLFLFHNKGKLEIVSGYPENDLLKIQKMLEKYLAGETMENIQDVPGQTTSSSHKSTLKGDMEGLFGLEPLDATKCLKRNAVWGLILAIGILVKFMPDKSHKIPELIKPEHVVFTLTFLLGAIWLVKQIPGRSLILRIQGLLYIAMVPWYTMFMWGVLGNGLTVGRATHVPGILALSMAYGVRQFIDFSNWQLKRPVVKKITIFFAVIGGVSDAFVLYLVVTAFLK